MKQTYFGTQKQISGTTTVTLCISSTKKGISHITKLMVISLILILFLTLTSSLEFNLDSPESVTLNEEFTTTINADISEDETYDIKIFVHKATKEFSEIYDGTIWKSPHFYLESKFPEQKDFKIISHFEGETKICARLRKS